ncbi:SCY1-like protein 2 isoform X2 [Hyalella azteca]|uniref:SCY1-like protein 2 isoform X2 n=1 Tax=Hyalella azteca TaxID=294128 RepID=A0A979FSP6_HYAAZ|nr:SCY1-like protein 2 isoform X2 [Hyalella azteca]
MNSIPGMENVLNKLRSTMSSAASNAVSNAVSIASQVSNYLPGNPVTREFEAIAHIASAGPGLSWKIYSGYKKSSHQDVSLFVFEKRSLDRWDRQHRDLFLDLLRKGVAQLTRLRHPQILTVQHPLEESRDSLAFATEPVLGSLANVLGSGCHNLPSPVPAALQGYKLEDVEIKYGFVQICEGLQFLNDSVKAVHCSISPDTVVVSQHGAWKLFGFDFCLTNSAASDAKPSWQFPEYRPSLPPPCLPPLEYLAPECILDEGGSVGPPADMYSVGVLVTAVFNAGRPYTAHKGDIEGYKKAWRELARVSGHQLTGVPEPLRDDVRRLLSPTPSTRPTPHHFSQLGYFSDLSVKTLSYLDQLFQWDNVQKSQFYKGLPQLIPQLPHRVALLRVVPAVVQETVNPSMVPFVLPVVLLVAERATDEEFVKHVLPHLKPIMRLTEPVQVLVQLMQQMSLLLTKTPASDVRSDVLPLLYRALDTDTSSLQELCLAALPACARHLDKTTMKTHLLPRIQKLCLSTTNLSVRVSCLVCVGRLLPQLDKWLVLDSVVPFVTQLPSREAPVIMAATGILQVSLTSSSLGLTKEVMATKILPFLLPLSIESCLSIQQHATLMKLIRDMVDKVEAEQKDKLQYLNSIKDEQKTLHQMMPDASSSKPSIQSGGPDSELDSMFAGLGLGQYVSPRHTGAKSPIVSPAGPPPGADSCGTLTPSSADKSSGLVPKSNISPKDLTGILPASPLPPPPQYHLANTSLTSNSFTTNSNSFTNSSNSFTNSTKGTPGPMILKATASSNLTKNPGGLAAFDDLLPSPPTKSLPMAQMNVQAQTQNWAPTGTMQAQNWAATGGMQAQNWGSTGTMQAQNWATPNFNQGFAVNNMNSAGPVNMNSMSINTMNNMTVNMNNLGVNSMNNMGMGSMNNMAMPTMNNMGINSMNNMSMNAINVMNSAILTPRQNVSATQQNPTPVKPLSSSDISDLLS